MDFNSEEFQMLKRLEWLENDGVIYALNQVYCTGDSADDGPAHPLFYETLDKHRLASFPLTD